MEPTPEAYVARLVALFALLRPALRDDGTMWLNLGDSYSGAGYSNNANTGGASRSDGGKQTHLLASSSGLKPKDLCGIPWRVAFALQADGWYLRQDIIWHKPNPMPESVTDRCTKAHEYIFLLSKSARYYYDHEAIKEPSVTLDIRKPYCPGQVDARGDGHDRQGGVDTDRDGATRNKRDVWTVPTRSFPQAHFATFPAELITPCILAGVPERCCPKCGAPHDRITERVNQSASVAGPKSTEKREQGLVTAFSGYADGSTSPTFRTTGYSPTCDCGCEPVAGTVLDPFMGSGTTAATARSLGRKSVGFELNADYIEIAAKHRLAQGVLL